MIAVSLEPRFCDYRKDGIEAGGQGSSDIVVASGLGCRNIVVGIGWAISLILCTNGLRKESSGHTGFPFLAVKLFSQRSPSCEGKQWNEAV